MWFLQLLEVNVLRNINHPDGAMYFWVDLSLKKHQEPLIYEVFRNNKGVTFHSWGRGLIPESLVPEVQAI